jgi:hypothetical protein
MPDVAGVAAAEHTFNDALRWLRESYSSHVFYLERDVVFVIQTYLRRAIDAHKMPLAVFNDYPMLPGPRRSFSADLVLRTTTPDETIVLAAEFKYEPSHRRADILARKLPVVVWSDVLKDITRIEAFVTQGKTPVGYAVCLDEGGFFERRPIPPGAAWQKWESPGLDGSLVRVLLSRYGTYPDQTHPPPWMRQTGTVGDHHP